MKKQDIYNNEIDIYIPYKNILLIKLFIRRLFCKHLDASVILSYFWRDKNGGHRIIYCDRCKKVLVSDSLYERIKAVYDFDERNKFE